MKQKTERGQCISLKQHSAVFADYVTLYTGDALKELLLIIVDKHMFLVGYGDKRRKDHKYAKLQLYRAPIKFLDVFERLIYSDRHDSLLAYKQLRIDREHGSHLVL